MKSGFCVQNQMTGALCVLLLPLGTSWPTHAGDAKGLTAILAVARAELPDSNFGHSVAHHGHPDMRPGLWRVSI